MWISVGNVVCTLSRIPLFVRQVLALLREATVAASHVWTFKIDLAKELLRTGASTSELRAQVSTLLAESNELQPHSCETTLRAAEFHIDARAKERRSQPLAEAYARAACRNCAGGKEAVNACVLHANTLGWGGDWAGAKVSLQKSLTFVDAKDEQTRQYLLNHIQTVENNVK